MTDRWIPALPETPAGILLNPRTPKQALLQPYSNGGPFVPHGRSWRGGGFIVIASIDPTPHGPLLHVSISHKHRDPTWEEIKKIRAIFFPADVDSMMMLPQESDYINVHAHCFHLWQTPVEWAVQ